MGRKLRPLNQAQRKKESPETLKRYKHTYYDMDLIKVIQEGQLDFGFILQGCYFGESFTSVGWTWSIFVNVHIGERPLSISKEINMGKNVCIFQTECGPLRGAQCMLHRLLLPRFVDLKVPLCMPIAASSSIPTTSLISWQFWVAASPTTPTTTARFPSYYHKLFF